MPTTDRKRVAVYLRVSRSDQTTDNQRPELERYVSFRQWEPTWFVEHGVSGAKETRPALDEMMSLVRKGAFDAVLVLKLDRLGRSLKHLIAIADELKVLGVDFVTMGEGIDTTTAQGRLMFQLIGSFAEFERALMVERTKRGIERAHREGRKSGRKFDLDLRARLSSVDHLSVRKAAKALGCAARTVFRMRKERQLAA